MIRPLRLRDSSRFLAAVRAGLPLDERAARVDRFHPVEAATLSLFFPDLIPVLTLTDRTGSYFLQIHHRRREGEVRLLFMAPVLAVDEPEAIAAWEALFDGVVEWAGAHGVRRLVAEVALDDLRSAILRRFGFQRIRRYTVWAGPVQVIERAFEVLTGQEPISSYPFWAIHRGPRGAWVEEIRSARGSPLRALARALTELGIRWRHAVYVQVRWETPEMVEALRALGFHPAFVMGRMVRWVAIPALRSAEEVPGAEAAATPIYSFHQSAH